MNHEYESLINPLLFFSDWTIEEFYSWCMLAESENDLWALYSELKSCNMFVHAQIVYNVIMNSNDHVLMVPMNCGDFYC